MAIFQNGLGSESLGSALGGGGLSVVGGGAAAPSSLLTDITAYWLFQEPSGSRADSVGASTLLEVGGATGRNTGPGAPLTYGAEFVTGRTLEVATNANLERGSGDFTLAGWIYEPSYRGGILSNDDGNDKYAYSLRVVDKFYFYCGNVALGQVDDLIDLNTWLFIRAWYKSLDSTIHLRINEGPETSSATNMAGVSDYTVKFGVFTPGGNSFNGGRSCGWHFWKRILTDAEGLILAAGGAAGVYPFDSAVEATPDLLSPVSYQVAQGTTINITGSMKYAASNVEASFNGGAYADIATAARGVFSGTLSAQTPGQGALTIRAKTGGATASKSLIGLGDVFVIAGQSNASGRGTNNQAYSHVTLKAGLYGNDYVWHDLTDPTDSVTGQIDTVSSDAIAAGSIWPLVATSYMAARSAPCEFVPCAKGGSSITDWLPGVDHQDRSTLYGSMVYRALQTGCKAILFWQGEQDAFAGMLTATYQGHMATIVTALATDLTGVMFVAAKLHLGNTYSDAAAAQIQTAIGNIWAASYANVISGPDLSDLRSESGDHFISDSALAIVAGRWWTTLQAAFGW
jgi:hypothetical protein